MIAIGKAGFNVGEEEAWDLIWGYAVGNDLTRRDLQLEARDKGRPWDWGKAFDNSAVCGPIRRASETGRLEKGAIRLMVNGTVRQDADLADLIWSVPEIVSILSRAVRLARGRPSLHRNARRRRGAGSRRCLRGRDRGARHADNDDRGAGGMTGLVLHDYFRSSTSIRLRAALNLKGLSYDQIAHHLRKGEQRDAAYLAINPQGLVPALVLRRWRGPDTVARDHRVSRRGSSEPASAAEVGARPRPRPGARPCGRSRYPSGQQSACSRLSEIRL